MNPNDTLLHVGALPALDLSSWVGGLGVFAIAWLLGRAVWGRGKRTSASIDELLIQLTLGLALLPVMVLALGQVEGLLFQAPMTLIGGAAIFISLLWIALIVRRRGRSGGAENPSAVESNRSQTQLSYCGAMQFARVVEISLYLLLAGVALNLLFVQSAPPLNYDTLEYHLGVVPHYFEVGRVEPIPHVFYSAQPIATELLYFLASLIEGSPWGLAAGKFQWLLIVLMAALLGRCLVAAGLPRLLMPIFILLLVDHPILVLIEVDRMTDITGVVMLLGGWLLWLTSDSAAAEESCLSVYPDETRASQQSSRIEQTAFPIRSWLGWGILSAGAVSSKWTNAGTAAVAILLPPLLWFALRAWKRDRPAFKPLAALIAGFSLIIAPWLGWVWVETENPIAPFGASLFPTERWDAARGAWLLETHGPLSPLSGEYWSNLHDRLIDARTGSWPIAVAVALVLAANLLSRRLDVAGAEIGDASSGRGSEPHREKSQRSHAVRSRNPLAVRVSAQAVWLLPAGLLAAVVTWLLWGRLEHAAFRFLAPVAALGIVLLAIALGLVLERLPGITTFAATALLGIVALLPLMPTFARPTVLYPSQPHIAYAVGQKSELEFMGEMLGLTANLFYAANELPEDSRIMAIGEARRYYFRRPISLATVFDVHPIRPFLMKAASPEDLEHRLVKTGYTHLLVNQFEILRLLEFHPPPVLEADTEFMQLREEKALIGVWSYSGYVEFGVDPIPAEKRRLYNEFLLASLKKISFKRDLPETFFEGSIYNDAGLWIWIVPLRATTD